MSYVALYRKFRPSKFSEVKGQEHVVKTLRNQIINNKLGHAYIFTGTRGTGKTSVAKLLAKAANCEHPVNGDPCGECDSCKAIAKAVSLNVIEIDAASNNGVDDVRQIIDEVQYSPTSGKYKIYIIDEAHMLSKSASNALLKTLEEPPEYAIFILATTEVNKLPITILSRCQRYDFKRITSDIIVARMKELMDTEGQQVEDKALSYIAKVADGSMRDALSLLDRCLAFYFEGELTYEKTLEVLGAVDNSIFNKMLDKILEGDALGSINVLKEVTLMGKEVQQFINDFSWYLRNILVVMTADNITEDELEMSAENLKELKEYSKKTDQSTIIRFINVFNELTASLRQSGQKQILTEIALIKLTKPQMENSYEALLNRVSDIEKKLENGDFLAAKAVPVAALKEESPKKKLSPSFVIPEEIKWIAENFDKFYDELPGTLKAYINDGRLKISTDGSKTLFLVTNSDTKPMLEAVSAIKAFSETIKQVLNRKVDIEYSIVDEEEKYDEYYKDIRLEITEE